MTLLEIMMSRESTVIEEILYYFDEPLIFTAKVRGNLHFFLKIGEIKDNLNDFISCIINCDEVSLLKMKKISVRDLLIKKKLYRIQISTNHMISSSEDMNTILSSIENIKLEDIIHKLPKEGVFLYP